MLSDFTVTANTIAATTKKSEKERTLAQYLLSLDDASLERAAVFFSGSPFARREERVPGVGWATIADAVIEATGRTSEELWAAWPKYDGIRAQIHSDGDQVRIYSRTLDNVTHRFPEIETAARALVIGAAKASPQEQNEPEALPTDAAGRAGGRGVILDGEIVAFSDRILPFATIQTRLGRRKVSEARLRDAPVAYFAFDLLHLDGGALFEMPLSERLSRLRACVGQAPSPVLRLSAQSPITDAAHVDALFDAARTNEGLVVKDPRSIYTLGRRGKSWLKCKKALATLDCVVTAAEYGHGKRRAVLSDYTFAVVRDNELVNIGKAYSGLTDAEIDRLTKHFKETTTARHGPLHVVEPTVVLEIAFDRIQESSRHKSGYALRFPRIARIRDDKTPDQISTIDEVRRVYEGQLKREGSAES